MRNPGQSNPDHGAILATAARARRIDAASAGGVAVGEAVLLNGVARPGPAGLLTAPVSGRPCVWFRVLDVDWPGSVLLGGGRPVLPPTAAFRSDMHYPVMMGTQTGGESTGWFAVADQSGEVLVDPTRADVDATVLTVDTINAYSTFGEGRAVREWIVPEGSPVFVCGAVRTDQDRPVVVATPDTCLVVSALGEQGALQRSRTVSAALPGIGTPGYARAGQGRNLAIGLGVGGVVLFLFLVVFVVVLAG